MADSVMRPRILNAVQLMALELPEPRWAVTDLIPEGLSIFAGRPKTGKSWLMLGVGLAVACGGRALGRVKVTEGDVLYLALEDSARRLKERIEMQLAGAAPSARFNIAREWPRGELGVTELEKWLRDHPDARLIVIDTLAKFRVARNRERGYADDYADMEPLQKLASHYGVAIVVVHHQRKLDAEDWIDTLSGTLGLAGAADGLLGLFRVRGELQAELKITGRDLEDQALGLRFNPDDCNWVLLGSAAETVELSQERQEMLNHLSRLSRPVNAGDLARELGKPYNTIRRRLQRMSGEGLVIPSSAGWTVSAHVVSRLSRSSRSDVTDVTDVTQETDVTYETSLLKEGPDSSEACVHCGKLDYLPLDSGWRDCNQCGRQWRST